MLMIIKQEKLKFNSVFSVINPFPFYSPSFFFFFLTFWVEKYQMGESMQKFAMWFCLNKLTNKQNA